MNELLSGLGKAAALAKYELQKLTADEKNGRYRLRRKPL